MVAFFITSLILIAAILYALYRWQRNSVLKAASERVLLPPDPGFQGLFGASDAAPQPKNAERPAKEAEAERALLLDRARRGEKEALADAARFPDETVYTEALNALLDGADSDQKLLGLVSFIARATPRLGVNRRLAERFLESWKAAPDRSSTAKMLHVVALADDAAIYGRAVNVALDFLRQGRVPLLSVEELRALAESEYWILSQAVRSSGEGFLLKRQLARLRREVSAEKRASG